MFKEGDINEIREIMEEIDYRSSWGIKYGKEIEIK